MKLRGIYSSFSSKSSALKSLNITKLGQYSFKIITLTELEKLGEEFQHSVTKLWRQVFIGRCHHNLDKLTTEKEETQNM